MRIGFVVNPVAGMGGAVGLRGTDGPDTVAQALRSGAVAQAGPRARRTLQRLAERLPGARLTVAKGALGAEWAAGLALAVTHAGPEPETGTAKDTLAALAAMAGHDLVVFAGGDGTARDVAGVLAPGTAVLGIPCGVKMHSGVFAVSPEAAGAIVADLLGRPGRVAWDEQAEVMDIDEEALRAGRLGARLYGFARVPLARSGMQAAKGGSRHDSAVELKAAAEEAVREMEPGALYIVGPGTSAGAVVRAAGQEPTLLGVDALRDGRMVARDADAALLRKLAGDGPVRIVVGVTGRQGFLLGRGNQQIAPELIAAAGREGLVVLATEAKLTALAQPNLWVDTGDAALDARLAGFVRVRTGAGRRMMMRIGQWK